MSFGIDPLTESPQLAEDCRLTQSIECLLWRKQTLRVDYSGAANDP